MPNHPLKSPQFSRFSATYDQAATIQSYAANALCDRIRQSAITPPHSILDIGCGTGRHTKQLLDQYPNARVLAIDISENMIDYARRHYADDRIDYQVLSLESLVAAPAYHPISRLKFDLVFSNATFQWIHDLALISQLAQRIVTPNGVLAFSCFGPRTFWELDTILHSQLNIHTSSYFFHDIKNIALTFDSLQCILLEEVDVRESADTLYSLIRSIRLTGAYAPSGRFWTSRDFHRLEAAYYSMFGTLLVTYQLFFGLYRHCSGNRPKCLKDIFRKSKGTRPHVGFIGSRPSLRFH